MKNKILSNLEKTLAKISGAIIGAEYFLAYHNFDALHASALSSANRFKWLPIENSYFGDAPEIFAANLASGFIGDKIEKYGQNKGNEFVAWLGRHFPTLTAVGVGGYYTLGETILPQILPGTPDSKDIPAVVITSLASPFVTNYIRKKWSNWKTKISANLRKINLELTK